jgi:hypothetical protein
MRNFMTYKNIYQSWEDDPTGCWAKAAEGIDWYEKWDRVKRTNCN